MSRCIFCLGDSSSAKGLAHVVPEGLGRNDFVLPKGAVCDPCNQYLGHELDSVLVAHPIIALHVQFLGLHGKDGKPRAVLGNVARNVYPNALTIPCDEPVFSVDETGARTGTARALVPKNLSLTRFRRALYHVALNTIALQDGVERALDPVFNPARKYVRAPGQKERRRYVQLINLTVGIRRDCALVLPREPGAEIVAIALTGNSIFAVDLVDSGKLEAWAAKDLPAGWTTVRESEDVPRESGGPDGKQFRMSIYLDGSQPGDPL